MAEKSKAKELVINFDIENGIVEILGVRLDVASLLSLYHAKRLVFDTRKDSAGNEYRRINANLSMGYDKERDCLILRRIDEMMVENGGEPDEQADQPSARRGMSRGELDRLFNVIREANMPESTDASPSDDEGEPDVNGLSGNADGLVEFLANSMEEQMRSFFEDHNVGNSRQSNQREGNDAA